VNARKTGQQRHHKTEGGRQSVVLFGDDLMQRAAGKAALRQIAIDGGKAEGNWAAFLTPSILGNKRRSSSATAVRLRNTEKPGKRHIALYPRGSDTRTKQEQCQGTLFP
jgi:hypothetical protein